MHQFPISMPNPSEIRWYYPEQAGNSIRGDDDAGKLFEWYGQSGGQLKYYPKVSDALWQSDVFRLEPLPPNTPHGLISKAETYYPNLWPR